MCHESGQFPQGLIYWWPVISQGSGLPAPFEAALESSLQPAPESSLEPAPLALFPIAG